MKKRCTLAFATLAVVFLTFGHARADDPVKKDNKKTKTSTDCSYTKTAIGYAAIDCRGQTIIRGPFSQSCTINGPCSSNTEITAQECANANLGAYIAAQIAQMIAACKDVP